jgi:hypothetical protein
MTEEVTGRAANLAKARAARAANRAKARMQADVEAVRLEVSGYGVAEAVMATPERVAPAPVVAAAPVHPAKPTLSAAEASKERARRRSAAVRENMGDMDQGIDEFYIDPRDIPEGWSYEWKTNTVIGQPNPAYQVQLQRMGWDPVPAERHPHMMPVGDKSGIVERKGMVLMERPLDLTEEAKAIEMRRARQQIQNKQEQLGQAQPGHFERNNKDNPLVKIKKGYEPVQIPS